MDPAIWRRPQYLTSAHRPEQIPPPGLPEIAVAGRSNSGKSSLINCVTERRGLARVSGQPGRTQALNFFSLGEALLLVDLPGYGFARASKGAKARWQSTVTAYFGQERPRLGLILTVDIRRLLGELDFQLLDLAEAVHTPVLVALTKADKLRHAARQQAVKSATDALADRPTSSVIAFSSRDRSGIDAVRATAAGWHDEYQRVPGTAKL